jgi:energy-converting hydrogenase Eha subunit A
MSSVAEYIVGLLLCLMVSLVYSMARKDRPRAIVRETALVFLYTVGAIGAVVLLVFLACQFK